MDKVPTGIASEKIQRQNRTMSRSKWYVPEPPPMHAAKLNEVEGRGP